MCLKKTWKYSNNADKNSLGIIRNATEEKPITIRLGFTLIEEYNSKVKVFKSADRNYPKFMYEILTKLLQIGKSIKDDFTIKQLCKDLDITYERYKFYMKYEQIDEETEKLIDNKELSQSVILNIIHRFPKNEWKNVIEKELKYKLTKNDLSALRTNDKFKDVKEWDKIYDERTSKRIAKNKCTNKRSVQIWCDKLIREVDNIQCFNNPTKKKIYGQIKKTHDKLEEWLNKNKEWVLT